MITEMGLLRLGLVAMEVGGIGFLYYSRKKRLCEEIAKESNLSQRQISFNKRTAIFESLFENIGLMDKEKGDWIKVVDSKQTANYSQVTFVISDSLNVDKFKKSLVILKEKLDKKHLEIYGENKRMYFRSRNENMPLIPYRFKAGPKNRVPLGLNIDDEVVEWWLSNDPHMLICGSTGCGKSRFLNSVIDHVIHNNNPQLYLIDLKRGLELGVYRNMTLTVAYADMLKQVDQVIAAFTKESDKRFEILKEAGYNDYEEYINAHPGSNMKRAFLIIDEFADITGKKSDEVVDMITSLARTVRCCGMHIIIATQRPTTDFISASTKASLQCVIGMKCINEHNSRLIIDETGLEELKKAEAIGIINSKKVFFRAFHFNREISKATAEKYAKDTNKSTA